MSEALTREQAIDKAVMIVVYRYWHPPALLHEDLITGWAGFRRDEICREFRRITTMRSGEQG